LSKARGLNEGEFALLISDRWQKQGLGSELLKRLVDIARSEKLTRVSAIIMSDNHAMLHVCKKTGFDLKADPENRDYTAEFVL
jgi:acetyltransferase